ncbi:MAG: S-layer homology domain-containing protein [Oscillospiraceae bacterium]|nr:S-layer homology domain-containing protein [Oscillospiraceae bacterium]
MKIRAFALILALCVAFSLLTGFSYGPRLQQLPQPAVEPAALPVFPEPQAKTYSVTMTSTGPGVAELYADKAGAQESVYFLADPEPGYRVSFDKCGYYKEQYDMRLIYIGSNVYEIVMPDGDVLLNLEFVKIESSSHKVSMTVSEGGMASVDQTSAKNGESLFVEVIALPGYSLESVKAKSQSGWNEGYHLGKTEGAELYEIFMPDEDLEIIVTFKRNGPYTVTPRVDGNGTVKLSHQTAYELETVTVTAVPDRGHEVVSIGCYHSQITKTGTNTWTFPMPRFKEEVHVTFAPVNYPVTVVTELPMGGVAYLDRETATIGQTATLTCVPDEGYRVARITGAALTDNGDNTYTFVMDASPVELSVLFLRENNPFLDVNETQYYHDPVLWAVENGITNGVSADLFGPMGVCNRAQVVTFLWRAAGSPAPEGTEIPFTDVPAGSFYTDAVLWAVESGITNGLTETTFGPNTVCNRAQVVTFLHRTHGSPAPKTGENPFADIPAGSFYTDAVLWALENGVTSGASATTFNPGGDCLRAQVVTFLYRADQIPEPAPDPLPFPDIG